MSVAIQEIIGRSSQGVSRPFQCRSADGRLWFVKSRINCGTQGLRAEWIGGTLARELALPVAAFEQVEIDPGLIAMSAVETVAELGSGPGFGSQAVAFAEEITFSQAINLPLEMRAKILLFDLWIQNEDRILTGLGGNPNLLVSSPDQLWLIDHHAAFDLEFDRARFWKNHIFRDCRSIWSEAWRARQAPRLEQAAKRLGAIWDGIPAEWAEPQWEVSPTCGLERDRIAEILLSPINDPAFWEIP